MSDTPETGDLLEKAIAELKDNDTGLYTIPAPGLYPHQWLWDSCFIAIGQRHYDVERAKIEILSLLRGQWTNGMLPHTIFNKDRAYKYEHDAWRSWTNPYSPHDIITSGITQPPMLAEAIWRIGEKLEWPERRSWYRQVLPNLIAYHEWLYRERDPHGEGLTLQIHPWETGLDNTPPWIAEMHDHLMPWWIRAIQKAKLAPLISMFRRDRGLAPNGPRYSTIDALCMYDAHRRLRRKAYDIDRILNHSLFTIEDLTFNSILVRANALLREMARSTRTELAPELLARMEQTAHALNDLWDPYAEQYFSRDFITHKLLKEPSIASLMPLYAGSISKERAALLVKSLESQHLFGPAYPIPSVPLNSPWFDPYEYWQGPTWFNTNWLIINGLRRYGYHDHADALVEGSLELADKHGFFEYYNPITGEPLGAHKFAWTAACVIDWISTGIRRPN